MTCNVVMTKHGQKRTKDRVGLSKKIAEKNAQRAMEFGLEHSEAKGSLRRYVDRIYLTHRLANNIRIYNHFAYMFQDAKLITVLPLPSNLCPLADKLQRQKQEKGCEKSGDRDE